MFNPKHTIIPAVAKGLMCIEAVKQSIVDLPIIPAASGVEGAMSGIMPYWIYK